MIRGVRIPNFRIAVHARELSQQRFYAGWEKLAGPSNFAGSIVVRMQRVSVESLVIRTRLAASAARSRHVHVRVRIRILGIVGESSRQPAAAR
jgi:hypothetical protein